MIKLYQFPISHFCEKARWALDYKGIDYRKENLLPGPHIKVIKGMAKRSNVPVLVDGDKCVQESAEIISYLDEKFPEKPLTPLSPGLKTAALEWEKYLNKELGIHVRRLCYHYVLQDRAMTIKLLAHDAPWYGRIMLRFSYGKLVKAMRKHMDINAQTAEDARQHILGALERINQHLRGHEYLVGDQFTRADLTAAALLAPVCLPAKYPAPIHDDVPEPLAKFIKSIAPNTRWVHTLYEKYR